MKQYKSMSYSILCLSDCNILQYVEYRVSSKEKNIIMLCIIKKVRQGQITKTRQGQITNLVFGGIHHCLHCLHSWYTGTHS